MSTWYYVQRFFLYKNIKIREYINCYIKLKIINIRYSWSQKKKLKYFSSQNFVKNLLIAVKSCIKSL